jgi:hypothetical protein
MTTGLDTGRVHPGKSEANNDRVHKAGWEASCRMAGGGW